MKMQPPPERLAMEEASTSDLVREALDEAKELVRLEVELAKTEVTEELAEAKKAAVGFVVAGAFMVLALCLLSVALVLALGGTAVVALVVAGVFMVIAGIGAFAGYSMLPKKPLEQTRRRMKTDFQSLKEHLA